MKICVDGDCSDETSGDSLIFCEIPIYNDLRRNWTAESNVKCS